MATASSMASMGSMGGMGGMDMPACKISMLWNWYTVDACFLSSAWQIRSSGMFAGSCIGVVVLTMTLSLLRRLHRVFDAHIARTARANTFASFAPAGQLLGNTSDTSDNGKTQNTCPAVNTLAMDLRRRRPTLVQQAIRALLHMAQFAVAYFVMLLAMYYNGYIIISIFIGAFLGYFVFDWEPLGSLTPGSDQHGATEVTGCCG